MRKLLLAATILLVAMVGGTDTPAFAQNKVYIPKIGDSIRFLASCNNLKSVRSVLEIARKAAGPGAPMTPEYKKFMSNPKGKCTDIRVIRMPVMRGRLVRKAAEYPLWQGKLIVFEYENDIGEKNYTWRYLAGIKA